MQFLRNYEKPEFENLYVNSMYYEVDANLFF